ncbi:Thioredoxin/protein disulfide isomerase [Globisporangium polare]
MTRLELLPLLLCVLCAWLQSAQAALNVLTTLEQIDEIESSPRLYALLVVSSEEAKDGIDALVEMATRAYPSLTKMEKDLDGVATLAVVDIAAQKKALVSKWNLQGLPALLVYKDEPKENPYTGKVYRNPMVGSVELLNQPAKLKKLLRDAVPSTFVTELSGEQVQSKEAIEQLIQDRTQDGEKLVLLASKQKKPSHLYRALSTEFHGQGLSFAYVQHKENKPQGKADKNAILELFGLEKVPALLVVESVSVFHALDEDKMKTYQDLKAFTEQFADKEAAANKSKKKNDSPSDIKRSKMNFLTENTFAQEILKSKVVWIIAFTNSDEVAASIEASWKKIFEELQKKAGMVAITGVRCEMEPKLCEKYGGPGIRVFPVKISPRGVLERGEVLPETFTELEAAKEAALASIPDQVQVIHSSADLTNFISKAALSKALPVLLFTAKPQTPAMLKAVSLSLPTSNVAFGLVPDADAQLKAQFTIPASASTALACLVPAKPDPNADQPEGAAPLGIILYNKKSMGPYTYENMMHYMLSVLSQYPHPKEEAPVGDDALNDQATSTETTSSSSSELVPYLKKDNLAELCDGNKICAIGFFEGHVNTLASAESPLSKSMGVLSKVAALSTKSKEPFHFMWTNGKCQKAFAEAFGVGEFQMPTVVVFSPSKSRYATNVGTFTEENTHGFLKSVLSGKISTSPVAEVPELQDECSFEQLREDVASVIDDNEDDADLLSEILDDEQKQRELLEAQLKTEQKKSDSKGNKKSKKSKKKRGKKNKRDEL